MKYPFLSFYLGQGQIDQPEVFEMRPEMKVKLEKIPELGSKTVPIWT